MSEGTLRVRKGILHVPEGTLREREKKGGVTEGTLHLPEGTLRVSEKNVYG